MSRLLIGFDSAWTPNNLGAIVGLFHDDQGYQVLGNPQSINYPGAQDLICQWQNQYQPEQTIIMLDQPTIVPNATGKRPVERIVSSPVGRRKGGVQPANTGKASMFGLNAPVWQFVNHFGGPANIPHPVGGTRVIETYPVLALIAMGWTFPDGIQQNDRLPKYNPARATFSINDWMYVCNKAITALSGYGLNTLVNWLNANAQTITSLNSNGKKHLQDRLDAVLCLLVAIKYHEADSSCLMVGNNQTGYMVAPYDAGLHNELVARCCDTDLDPVQWIQQI